MKFSVKLNAAQVNHAKKWFLVSNPFNLDSFESKDEEFLWKGNLLGFMENHTFHYNPNQNLNLEGNIITYKGARHPLHVDGALRIIFDIVTLSTSYYASDAAVYGVGVNHVEKFISPRVFNYSSSVKGMFWYELMSNYEKRAINCSYSLVKHFLLKSKLSSYSPIKILNHGSYDETFAIDDLPKIVEEMQLSKWGEVLQALKTDVYMIDRLYLKSDPEHKIWWDVTRFKRNMQEYKEQELC